MLALSNPLTRALRRLEGPIDPTMNRQFAAQERRTLMLAGWCQVAVALSVIVLFAFSSGFPLAWQGVAFALAFAVLGIARVRLMKQRRASLLTIYPIVFLEAALIAAAIIIPNPFNDTPWPRQAVLRLDNDVFFHLLIAAAAFSYRPALVLWTALCSAVCWLAVSLWVLNLPDTVTFSSVPDLNDGVALRIFLEPTFVARGTMIVDVATMLLLGALLAGAVWRARLVVRRQLRTRLEQSRVQSIFGQFVPNDVIPELVASGGALQAVERDASIMMVDIEGFSQLVARKPPQEVYRFITSFFDDCGAIIAKHNGVVFSLQGDAVLAAFNVPREAEGFVDHAVAAACAIVDHCAANTFSGQRIAVRVGIGTGPVVAGIVGDRGRHDYTVYGESVNRAARLQVHNKVEGTRILIDEATARRLDARTGEGLGVQARGAQTLPGFAEPMAIYAVAAMVVPQPASVEAI